MGMGMSGTRVYVGFGLGAIQAGLFLWEAHRSGAFGRMVVAEVLPEVVEQVRAAGGYYNVNVAHRDRIERGQVGPVEVLNPAVGVDRARLIEAVAEADEIGTAVPSVAFYARAASTEESIAGILAAGMARKMERGGPRAVVYAAENHNHAAELLEGAVREAAAELARDAPGLDERAGGADVRWLNTVIGKMSRVVTDAEEIARGKLAPVTPGSARAFLVEAFNHILISRIHFEGPAFERGIGVFEEKDDLLPFEQAKLYGHNATHALGAYLGQLRGVRAMADLRGLPGVVDLMRAAFIEESGETLVRRWSWVDALFTREGYTAYADDLIERMLNPLLEDTIERVARDPARKLGWDDRLVGTMRAALEQGVEPARYSMGAAAAITSPPSPLLDKERGDIHTLRALWGEGRDEAEVRRLLALIAEGARRLEKWREAGYPAAEEFFGGMRAEGRGM